LEPVFAPIFAMPKFSDFCAAPEEKIEVMHRAVLVAVKAV